VAVQEFEEVEGKERYWGLGLDGGLIPAAGLDRVCDVELVELESAA
jgi:hypothetical protein